jgi:hypothetical protein
VLKQRFVPVDGDGLESRKDLLQFRRRPWREASSYSINVASM